MNKLFIKLRAKTWLPLKWGFQFRKKARSFEIRSNDELLFAQKEINNNLIEAERLERKYDIAKYEGILKFIDWLMIKRDGSS